MELKQAYEMVFEHIRENGGGLFNGTYDAKHGSRDFMNGIATAIEWIAYHADEDFDYFLENMVASQMKADGIKCYKCTEYSYCFRGQHGGKKDCPSYCWNTEIE